MISITRDNVEELLDQGLLYVQMTNSVWRQVRRNGKTRRWKRNPDRLEIPVKAGFRSYAATIFIQSPSLNQGNLQHFRHVDDVPKELRP